IIDPLGIRSEPACATCTTNSVIDSISAGDRIGSRMIERIAWKKAGQQKGQVEQISSRRAEQRIAQRMDEQSNERIGTTNYRWETELREPMRKRGNYPRAVSIWSSPDRLHLTAVQGQNSQLAAPTAPPAAPTDNLSVQVHQSLIANTAVNTIGGMTITDERAQELVMELTGDVPEELKIKQDEDPWSITFDLQQPVAVSFNDNQVRIAIRGRKFVRGNQVVRQTTQIAANYQLQIADGRVQLVRQGDIDVSYPDKDGDRLSLTELRNKTFLTNKFEGLFKKELTGEGLKLPDQWANLKDLALGYAAADNGWLSLGWQ
ncbi:MAG: hypothetical protein KDB23_11760, partial [Planctomycetales bacterium]|nr:hypothetical protein [Planctomycetales bacterium]